MKKQMFEGVAVVLVTLVLFKLGVQNAYEFRGYKAVGGEYLILLLPIIYLMVRKEIKNFLKSLKKGIDR